MFGINLSELTTLLRSLGFDKEPAIAAALSFLVELVTKRNETYAELWELVGDLCPPKLMGGVLNRADAIRRDDMRRIAREIDEWYRKNGVILDPVSRRWLIALREECFSWLAGERKPEDYFDWSADRAPRTWLVKTALRMSLNHNVTAPSVDTPSDTAEAQLEWMSKVDERIRLQLVRNYRVVYEAWSHAEDEVKGKAPQLKPILKRVNPFSS